MVLANNRPVDKASHAIAILGLYKNPVTRFLDYFGLLRKGSVHSVQLRNGLRFWVRAGNSDLQVIDELFIHRIYDRALRRIGPGQQVIDIGSHCGVFALAAAARGARVLCFEPMFDNVAALRRNVVANGLDSAIEIAEVAVAGMSGELDLYTRDFDSGGTTAFLAAHPEWATASNLKKVRIKCVMLRDVLGMIERCDCMKMDCEGAEYEIVQTAADKDLARIDSLILEYHLNGRVEEIGERLGQAGFSVEVSPRIKIAFAWRE